MPPFAIDFTQASSVDELAVMIGCEAASLIEFVNSPKRERYYWKHEIPKRRRAGEFRVVWEAAWGLSPVQKSLLRRLELFIEERVDGYPTPCSFGYIRGKNTFKNATQHCGQRMLLRADIADFFGSISRDRVETFFQSLGIKPTVSHALGALTTIDDKLAQGVHTSPLIANAVCTDLDRDLMELAQEYECVFTRYADDLSFSSQSRLPARVSLADVLQRHGFNLAEGKYRVTKRGQSHFVTGLSIAEATPRVPRPFKRRLRQELYYADKYGLVEHAEANEYGSLSYCVNTIDGHISYLQAIEPDLGARLRADWTEILERDGLFPDYGYAKERQRRDVHFFVDESQFETPDGPAMALALVLTHSQDAIRQRILDFSRRLISDPFTPGRTKKLRKHGLHFTDDHLDTRAEFVRMISEFNIRGFIAFRRGVAPDDFLRSYKDLLRNLLFDRLGTNWNHGCVLHVEQHQKISESVVKEVVDACVDDLKHKKRRLWVHPVIKVSAKNDEPCLAIADYLLALTREYLAPDATNEQKKRFERIRDKIRLVHDMDKAIRFHRKNPL